MGASPAPAPKKNDGFGDFDDFAFDAPPSKAAPAPAQDDGFGDFGDFGDFGAPAAAPAPAKSNDLFDSFAPAPTTSAAPSGGLDFFNTPAPTANPVGGLTSSFGNMGMNNNQPSGNIFNTQPAATGNIFNTPSTWAGAPNLFDNPAPTPVQPKKDPAKVEQPKKTDAWSMNASLVDMDNMLGSPGARSGKGSAKKRTPRSAGGPMPTLSTYGASRPNLQGMGMGMNPGMNQMNMGFGAPQQQRNPQMGFGMQQPNQGFGMQQPNPMMNPMMNQQFGMGRQQQPPQQQNPFGGLGSFS